MLAIDVEGKVVAQWLVERGIAAFVLKYRTVQQPSGGIAAGRGAVPLSGGMDEAGKHEIADGVQAIKVVREHDSEWGVLPNRVGIVNGLYRILDLVG